MVIDFHAHILPKVDHGCNSLDICIRQLQAAKKAGIDEVIASSHFYPHVETVSAFLERREKGWKQMQAILSDEMPNVLLGAEVLLSEGIDRMEGLEELCVQDTNILLIEMPFEIWEENVWKTLVRLEEKEGLKVVLAHIERYSRENREKILQAGYQVQINSDFVRSIKKRKIVSSFLERGLVMALGSDIHGVSRKYNNFYKAYRYLLKRGVGGMEDGFGK